MKKAFLLIVLMTSLTGLGACSPINSVQPFDQEQASKLIHQKPIGMPVRGVIR